MEMIVCQRCDRVIAFVEGEKSGILYGACPDDCDSGEGDIVGLINNKWSRNSEC
ncbi:SR1 protein [Thermoactinomyces sp. DSM 45891]|nr:GapA-binding peptide SR1P [Thermoactinomyces sp. DSM 45891]SFX27656.1 SR1 protein [Thermoactinomyces sp. DSM 45891]